MAETTWKYNYILYGACVAKNVDLTDWKKGDTFTCDMGLWYDDDWNNTDWMTVNMTLLSEDPYY